MKCCLPFLLFFIGCLPDNELYTRWEDWRLRQDFTEYSASIEDFDTIVDVATIEYVYIINMIEYKADRDDYWQTSEETLELGTGDCEDMAILLYMTLLELGVSEDKIALALVGDDEVEHCSVLIDGYYLIGTDYNIFYTCTKDSFIRVD